MIQYERRAWLHAVGAGLAAVSIPWARGAGAGPSAKASGCTLSIGTYSLKGIPVEEAIDLLAAIGYDGIEIAVQTGFDGEPAKMPTTRRAAVRRRLEASHLKLTALMENLPPAVDAAQHRRDVERLKQVAEMPRQLSPQEPPIVQSVLGGGKWEEKKSLFRDRLGDWVAVFQAAQIVLAIKPHRGGAMSRPEEAIWLIDQLGQTPWLRMVYDYSHYAFRDMPVEQTVRTALPYTAHVVVKDAVQRNGHVEFSPPGESGTFDYAPLLRLFYAGGYRDDVCCEVSAMVTKKPDYDARVTARACYRHMAAAFDAAKLPRLKPG